MAKAAKSAKTVPLSERFALSSQRAAELLDISVDTLDNYRKNPEVGWIQGVHWFVLPGGGIRYNCELLQDWLANAHDLPAHQKAISNFRASLPSARRKRAG